MNTDTPRIYVASLSDYNAAILHGRWIDATQEPEDIDSDVQAMLAESPTAKLEGQPAEEWAIHDYDNFGGLRLGEYEDFETVSKLACLLAAHGAAFVAWYENDPYMFEAHHPEDSFLESYMGCWSSVEEWAADHWEGSGIIDQVPQDLRGYIAFDRWARDCILGGDIWVHEAGWREVYVFTNH